MDERAGRSLDVRPLVPAAVGLADFLRTRVLELVVHADDLAASVALDPIEPAPEGAAVAVDALVHTARAAHRDLAVIRALTRTERARTDVFPVL